MKKSILLMVSTLAFVFTSLQAQVYEKKTLHAGESISAISYYLFPAFTNSTVKLKKGELVSKMNFNLLLCQMQFIDPHGDTMNLAHPEDVDLITFDSSLFYYKDEGYYQVFAATDAVKLAVLRKVSYEPLRVGAYGVRSHSGLGILTFSSVISMSSEKQLRVNEDVDILKETTYYLIDSNGEKLKANKSNFIQTFRSGKQAIETYLKENKTNFNKESDLKKLFAFCTKFK